MVQTEDHRMRSECAKEFGAIQTALAFHKEWRDEISASLHHLQLELEKLTGNGNRGKIDDLASKMQRIETMLTETIARADARQLRIERLEDTTKILESRLFSTSLKVAGAVGGLAIFIQFIWDHLIGK